MDSFITKVVTFIIILVEPISLEIDKCKFKNVASVSEV